MSELCRKPDTKIDTTSLIFVSSRQKALIILSNEIMLK